MSFSGNFNFTHFSEAIRLKTGKSHFCVERLNASGEIQILKFIFNKVAQSILKDFFFKTNLPFAHYSLYFFTVLCHSFWHCTFTIIFWCLVSRIILLNIFRCVFAKSLQNINLNFPHILVEKCVKQISIFLNLMINDLTNVSIISLENLFFVPSYM